MLFGFELSIEIVSLRRCVLPVKVFFSLVGMHKLSVSIYFNRFRCESG